MILQALHRDTTGVYEPIEYQGLAGDCVREISRLVPISAIVLCGSVAKDDIVTGWSDLDLIIFHPRVPRPLEYLRQVQNALVEAIGERRIGIGLDVVNEEEFARTHKLGARPLYASYDIGRYGRVLAGADPFGSLPPLELMSEAIIAERRLFIAAELHNWVRAFLWRRRDVAADISWLGYCTKTLLRLLLYETGPLMSAPFTYDGALVRLSTSLPSHPALGALREAVVVRRQWLSAKDDPSMVSQLVESMSEIIASYRIPG